MVLKYFLHDQAKESATEKYQKICHYYQTDFQKSLEEPQILFKKILQKEGKKLLVIKYPRQALFLEQMAQGFPHAKFIHLVRDARAVAMSILFSHQPQIGLKRWYDYNEAVLRLTEKLSAEQKILVRYEDIILQPQSTVSQIVQFLGYRFESAMLNYNQFHHADDDMTLWGDKPPYLLGNKPPAESPLHTTLQLGHISETRLIADYDPAVLSLYEQSESIRAMNERFGYT